MRRTVYSPSGAFPPASFWTGKAEFDYCRQMADQGYPVASRGAEGFRRYYVCDLVDAYDRTLFQYDTRTHAARVELARALRDANCKAFAEWKAGGGSPREYFLKKEYRW